MIKVFISQPMKDRTHEEILMERDSAIEAVKEKYGEEATILDSYFTDFNECKHKNVPLAYLAQSIAILSSADVAVFCEGWDYSRDCQFEYQCAIQYGIDVVVL